MTQFLDVPGFGLTPVENPGAIGIPTPQAAPPYRGYFPAPTITNIQPSPQIPLPTPAPTFPPIQIQLSGPGSFTPGAPVPDNATDIILDNYGNLPDPNQVTPPAPPWTPPLPFPPMGGPLTEETALTANLLNDTSRFGFQLRPYLQAIAGPDNPRTFAGFAGGTELAAEFFPFGSLGRVNDTLSPIQEEIQNRNREFAFGRTPLAQNALDRLQANADTFNQRDPEVSGILAQRKAGLGGFTAQEQQALREQLNRENTRGIQGALSAAKSLAGRSGVQGGAREKAVLPALGAFARARADTERDVFLANIDEKNRRMNEFENFVRGNLNEEASRSLAANQAFFDRNTALENFEQSKITNFSNLLQGQRDDLFNRQRFNIGQLGAEKAGQLNLLLGLGSFGSAQDNALRATDLAERGIGAAGAFEVPVFEFPEIEFPEFLFETPQTQVANPFSGLSAQDQIALKRQGVTL